MFGVRVKGPFFPKPKTLNSVSMHVGGTLVASTVADRISSTNFATVKRMRIVLKVVQMLQCESSPHLRSAPTTGRMHRTTHECARTEPRQALGYAYSLCDGNDEIRLIGFYANRFWTWYTGFEGDLVRRWNFSCDSVDRAYCQGGFGAIDSKRGVPTGAPTCVSRRAYSHPGHTRRRR